MPINKGAEHRKALRRLARQQLSNQYCETQAHRMSESQLRDGHAWSRVHDGLREGLRELAHKQYVESWTQHPWFRALRAIGGWFNRIGERFTKWGTP